MSDITDPEYRDAYYGSADRKRRGEARPTPVEPPETDDAATGDVPSDANQFGPTPVEPEALVEYEAWLRTQAIKEPWSFKSGTLRERLEWCRVQHQLASERPEPDKPRANGAWQHWHRACAEWYEQMVRDLDRLAVEPDGLPLDVPRLTRALQTLAGVDEGYGARLDSGEYGLLERPSDFADRIAEAYAASTPSEAKP